ncbi:hypothetical protein CFB40_12135 [Burkholderia sp. AU31652]|uniref:hypothetical protein n=1 Tax=Burkholderia sp. AU31652 TaxID=2015354 RepID=UPI000B7ACE2A|nr:hypothetical protein [Burkholderia sp. AU31652]OXI91046.1 hypothetical protein CFB40_12135 [Burkholderia sp. AU31652]
MSGIDQNNLFAMLAGTIATADEISQDVRVPLDSRAAAGRLRDALRSWRPLAFALKDWTPATTGEVTQ